MPDPTIPPPLTSYAQNFEDVLLWRALKDVEAGFYIDIGAQDPLTDSVSLAFYERGWRGLHVEPNGFYADKLRAARPDEEVVQAVISVEPGLADFYEIADSGLSTADAAIAERHQRDGFAIKKVSVPAMRLEALLDRFRGREIHWLKIDVEGFENQVIESWGNSPVRPWVLVVESTRPRTQEASAEWEPQLLERGYRPVHFDGLNRFYVSVAHAALEDRFAAGPNTFDDFVLAESNYFARPLANELRSLRHTLAEKSAFCSALEQGRADDRTYIGALEVALERAKRDLSEARQVERLQQESIDRDRAEFLRYQTELQERHAELLRAQEALQESHAALLHAQETLQEHHAELLRAYEALEQRHAELLRAYEALEQRHAELLRAHEALGQRHEEALRDADALTARLNAIEQSRSWRWTGVFRRLARLLKGKAS